ncbi:LacI family transcriptional regulator [Lactobacillus heilongjiangensis] [Lactiplantibacillus mudanjiangensis]|uniref:LacI family DNA-binding transcriptional regulator n=1 Tax=Lactiplantibacillus mudanjiangensis TaxID=1296538 RepID=UPI00101435B7|nr:LacI family transcriptional regulator [Lactobacillus heilongjiangensis] [Lactiplantibacillus mudanjiangensis]
MAKYSIKDIAQLAGVSVATVSRVINDNGRFSEETRKKVLAIIERTGYQTNFSAKNLRMNKSFSIGVLVPDISNYFFAQVVQKIEEILFKQGYATIICNTARSEEKEIAYLQMLESKGIDGLIVISGAKSFDIQKLKGPQKIPFVCIDRKPRNKSTTIFIGSNHYQGAFEATEHLLKNGCQHPVIAMHTTATPSGVERLNGFKDALKKNSIFFDDKQASLLLDPDHTNLTDTLKTFLKESPNTDGIFAINDAIAMSLMSNLLKMGIKVPKQIKVIGFDDTPQDNYSYPTLSSVRQDTETIATTAVTSLISLTKNTNDLGKSIMVPVTLVPRDSSI